MKLRLYINTLAMQQTKNLKGKLTYNNVFNHVVFKNSLVWNSPPNTFGLKFPSFSPVIVSLQVTAKF